MQCTCPTVESDQLIFTPRSAPNYRGNLHSWNRTVERYNIGQIRFFLNCSPGTPVSSTNKTDLHDIAEILLKVALNTINLTLEVISKETYLPTDIHTKECSERRRKPTWTEQNSRKIQCRSNTIFWKRLKNVDI
jgi:hypothetical protein